MTRMLCPKCTEIVDDPKETCPHCGAVFAKVYAHKNVKVYGQKPMSSQSQGESKQDWSTAFVSEHPVLALVTIVVSFSLMGLLVFSHPEIDPIDEARNKAIAKAERTAITNCIVEIRSHMRIPKSVDVDRWRIRSITRPDGTMSLGVPFTAKNAFGTAMEHEAICQTDNFGSLSEINIISR